jgi:hypothetical protein
MDCGYALARRHHHQKVDSPTCRIRGQEDEIPEHLWGCTEYCARSFQDLITDFRADGG